MLHQSIILISQQQTFLKSFKEQLHLNHYYNMATEQKRTGQNIISPKNIHQTLHYSSFICDSYTYSATYLPPCAISEGASTTSIASF